MEGRTIVRPDVLRRVHHRSRHRAFNGGPDNRPARPERYWTESMRDGCPSMEGRTIVRPDSNFKRRSSKPFRTFNGGPDNRPARHPELRIWFPIANTLQWRAGQSSGQTGRSMERQIMIQILQWRAGQSSGQTAHVFWGCLPACSRVLASGDRSRSFEGN